MAKIMPDQPKRGAKYRRISDDREGRELGVARQNEDLDALAARLGVVISSDHDYMDNDISASTKSKKARPDYNRMIADAKAGEFDVILAYTSGRLTRRPREHEDLIELGEHYGIQFQYVASPSFDLNTSAGRRVARILAANDIGEAEDIAERVQRKHRELAEQGKEKGGGSRPYGYEPDRKTIRESEATLIKEATRRILDNGQSLGGLVKEWNDKGIPTVSGTRWTTIVLRRMLLSARISGRREHHRVNDIGTITAVAEWPGIISHDDSDRLRELLGDPARRTNHTDGARRYLLTGFLYCGLDECELKLKARPQGDHQRSYVCAEIGRSHLRVHAESIETYVTEAAFDYLDEFVSLAAAIRPVDGGGGKEAKLWADHQAYVKRLERLESEYHVYGRMDERKFTRLSTELETLIADSAKALDHARGQTRTTNLPRSSAHARSLWDQRGLEWRRLLITTLIERVTVGPGVRGRNKFDPDRVSIQYRKPF